MGRSGGPVGKVSRSPEVSGGGTREGTPLANRDQFACKEFDNVVPIGTDGNDHRKDELTADEDRDRDADLVGILGLLVGDLDAIDHSAGEIIGYEACPNLLKDVESLAGVEFGGTHSVLQRAEGGLDTPATEIDLFEALGRELVGREVGDEGFVFAGRELEANDANRNDEIIVTAIIDEIKGDILADEADIALGEQTVFELPANDDEVDGDVEFIFVRKVDIVEDTLGVDILGTKEEVLAPPDDMGHVVEGTEAAVGDKDSMPFVREGMPVNDGAESGIFILLRDGLNDGVGVTIRIQIKEGGQMDAITAIGRVALGRKILVTRESGIAQEGERATIRGKEAMLRIIAERFERVVELIEDLRKRGVLQLGPLLDERGLRGMILVVIEGLDQLVARTPGTLADQQGHEDLRRQLATPGKIRPGIDNVLLDVIGDIRDRVLEFGQNVVM